MHHSQAWNIEGIEEEGLLGHASEGFDFGTASIKPNQINLFLLLPQTRLITKKEKPLARAMVPKVHNFDALTLII